MREDIFDFDLKDFPIGKGVLRNVDFPSFYGMANVQAPIYVHRVSKKISPCLVVTACVHGDEINGMHIAQKLIKQKKILLKGTLIIIPVVNIYGFLTKVRYLPDRKDLNRCFPGIAQGSFGSRFANFIFKNISRYGDFFIDLHSGGMGRFNVPQIRCDLAFDEIKELIDSISVPLVVNSSLRDGSLREAINNIGKPCIVFEGGEGLRIDETITKYGINLVRSIMSYLGMTAKSEQFNDEKMIIRKTRWIRAKQGGILINQGREGSVVKQGEVIGELRRISGKLVEKIKIPHDGIILGMSKDSLIMAGDALFNIGYFDPSYEPDGEEEFFDYFEL